MYNFSESRAKIQMSAQRSNLSSTDLQEEVMSTIELTVPASVEADAEESRQMMSSLIRDRLNISREQFLERLDAGQYAGSEDTELLHLVTLAPFAR